MSHTSSQYELGEILLSAEEIAEVVGRLGREICADYERKQPVLVNLLKGGVVFLADLMRQMTIPHHIDFLNVSSYGNNTSSSGVVRIVQDLSSNIEGRHVLVVEDVIDSGRTLTYIFNMLRLRSPKSLEVCALLRKPPALKSGISMKYVGKDIPSVFVVGYGLDYQENFRNLPYIAKLLHYKNL
ncbi:MAG: hypoxanthine phosphoribosyltransferase [Candidatus Latescibacteria bacterium]|nr:hypoxanthine phosphoribosyltransferase [Candidatus Latescibacterota bacterium]NIM66412.1 hypoxanthine phosphoribosyltransferase [Candidatus Latescibacterota bacterium]NIO02891.1 hypoxanthine phosphoribosyltransferase [Candidatus Latescibacterota bacterium]NIO30026.1 hypoxanthine phosphoribosyltransferase [Candidatus Latescibacterota bacterium]NIO57641.1 hypoxanthine phosphoribosyltransferase [Candidatus Latescibacterota bacterium]